MEDEEIYEGREALCNECSEPVKMWVKYDHIGGEDYIINDWGWWHLVPPNDHHESEVL